MSWHSGTKISTPYSIVFSIFIDWFHVGSTSGVLVSLNYYYLTAERIFCCWIIPSSPVFLPLATSFPLCMSRDMLGTVFGRNSPNNTPLISLRLPINNYWVVHQPLNKPSFYGNLQLKEIPVRLITTWSSWTIYQSYQTFAFLGLQQDKPCDEKLNKAA